MSETWKVQLLWISRRDDHSACTRPSACCSGGPRASKREARREKMIKRAAIYARVSTHTKRKNAPSTPKFKA